MKVWKTAALTFVSLLFLSAAAAQGWTGIKGEGPKVTKDLNIDKFDGFTLAIGGKVYVRQGSTQAVRVEAQQNIIDNLVTKVDGNVWKIRFDQNVRDHDGITVWITVPTLTRAAISGSGSIIGETAFSGLGNLDVGISGSGDLTLEVAARDIASHISGSGDINLRGSADKLEVHISGSGDIKAADLTTQTTDVHISGSGDCEVNATEDLVVSTSGSGDVYYRGRPRVKAKVSGSGEVQPKE